MNSKGELEVSVILTCSIHNSSSDSYILISKTPIIGEKFTKVETFDNCYDRTYFSVYMLLQKRRYSQKLENALLLI